MDNKQRRTDLRSDSWSGSGPGGLVVYDPRTDEGHLLNPSTAVVFEACDGRTSVDEIAQRVADHTGLPIDTGIVELALSELAEVGLLEASEGSPLAAGGGQL
jgi:PqqD family protein of HPr-rel-A system